MIVLRITRRKRVHGICTRPVASLDCLRHDWPVHRGLRVMRNRAVHAFDSPTQKIHRAFFPAEEQPVYTRILHK